MGRRMQLKGKRVVVMGLGLHGGGLATTQWLLKHGAHVVVTDTKTRQQLAPSLEHLPRSPRLTFTLGKHRLSDFRTADLIVQNPGVPNDSLFLREAKKHRIPIANEAAIFFDACQTHNIIAVTGTKGKSTTSTLIFRMLRARYGKRVFLAGNIRTTPMLSIVDRLNKNSVVVLELSSWQLERFRDHPCHPHIAVVTNLLDDHLNRYPSRQAYYGAKALIWKWQSSDDVTILNFDNAPSRAWQGAMKSRALWFSHRRMQRDGAFLQNGQFVLRENGRDRRIAAMDDLQIPGEHNHMNVLAAILAARQYGVPPTTMRTVLRTFRGIAHRMERVRTLRGVVYINDTTATAPDATIAALKSFPQKSILIAGGTDKGFRTSTYQALAAAMKKSAKYLILLPGTATEKVKKLLGAFPFQEVRSMNNAVRAAARMAEHGDVVLLSPGVASFGLFQHEFDRGEQFVAAVKKLC